MKMFMRKRIGIGFGLCALLGALSGCTTYVGQPGPPMVYVPAPRVVIEPPRVYVEPPRVYVAPPPVYVPPPAEVPAAVEIHTENDFVAPLSPYGHWETVEPYGRCW